MKMLLSAPRLTLCASFALLASPAFAHMGVVHEGCAAGQTFGDGDITVSQAFTRAMLAGARVGAGYMTIANAGATDDRLLAASSEVSDRVELHQMVIDNDMMRMSRVEGGIAVPAGGSVALAPGGLHVMFMEPSQEFQEGECVTLTLSFEHAGALEVHLSVGPVGASAAPEAHGDHGGETSGAAGHGH